jgi:hypothetical protein
MTWDEHDLGRKAQKDNGDRYRRAIALMVEPRHGGTSNPVIEMFLPPSDYFDAGFPGASLPVRVASLHDAKVFVRRWVIRDKEPALKLLLRHLEKANSSATADIAVRQLKQALACRGMLITASPQLPAAPRAP